MKRCLYIFAMLTTLFSFKVQTVLEDVVSSLKRGNSTQIAVNLDQQVALTLPQNTGSYGQARASKILADFLNEKTVKNFNVLHLGDNEQAQFCIGVLSTRKGDYRTTIFLRQRQGRFVVQEIRFESN